MASEKLTAFDIAMLLGDDVGALKDLRKRARHTRTEARGTLDFLSARLGGWPKGARWAEQRALLEATIVQMTEVEVAVTAALVDHGSR